MSNACVADALVMDSTDTSCLDYYYLENNVCRMCIFGCIVHIVYTPINFLFLILISQA